MKGFVYSLIILFTQNLKILYSQGIKEKIDSIYFQNDTVFLDSTAVLREPGKLIPLITLINATDTKVIVNLSVDKKVWSSFEFKHREKKLFYVGTNNYMYVKIKFLNKKEEKYLIYLKKTYVILRDDKTFALKVLDED